MKNKEKTIYGVVTKLVEPGIPGIDMKMREIKRLIADTPTVDPVKHGHWVIADLDGYDIECSNCHNEGPYGMDAEDVLKIPYCPWCGAKMDEVNKNG